MEKELHRYLLTYLIEQRGMSLNEMASQISVSRRNLQRVINGKSSAAESNSTLGQTLMYFVENKIPLEKPFADFIISYGAEHRRLATAYCADLKRDQWLPVPQNVTAEGVSAFNTFISFLDVISQYICSRCTYKCVPTENTYRLLTAPCSLSNIAAIVSKEIVRIYGTSSQ